MCLYSYTLDPLMSWLLLRTWHWKNVYMCVFILCLQGGPQRRETAQKRPFVWEWLCSSDAVADYNVSVFVFFRRSTPHRTVTLTKAASPWTANPRPQLSATWAPTTTCMIARSHNPPTRLLWGPHFMQLADKVTATTVCEARTVTAVPSLQPPSIRELPQHLHSGTKHVGRRWALERISVPARPPAVGACPPALVASGSPLVPSTTSTLAGVLLRGEGREVAPWDAAGKATGLAARSPSEWRPPTWLLRLPLPPQVGPGKGWPPPPRPAERASPTAPPLPPRPLLWETELGRTTRLEVSPRKALTAQETMCHGHGSTSAAPGRGCPIPKNLWAGHGKPVSRPTTPWPTRFRWAGGWGLWGTTLGCHGAPYSPPILVTFLTDRHTRPPLCRRCSWLRRRRSESERAHRTVAWGACAKRAAEASTTRPPHMKPLCNGVLQSASFCPMFSSQWLNCTSIQPRQLACKRDAWSATGVQLWSFRGCSFDVFISSFRLALMNRTTCGQRCAQYHHISLSQLNVSYTYNYIYIYIYDHLWVIVQTETAWTNGFRVIRDRGEGYPVFKCEW